MTMGFSIGGIASGLDTSSMIQQLMQIERQPVMRFQQRQAALHRVDKAWGEVVTKIQAFRSALDNVRDATDWSSFVSAISSNEDAVAVTTTGAADTGSLDFTVTSLAAAEKVAMTGTYTNPTAPVGVGDVTINGPNGAISVTTDASTTLVDLADMIEQADAGVDAQVLKVSETEHQLILTATDTGMVNDFTVTTNITELGAVSQLKAASDAELSVGGIAVNRSSNTITDLFDGVTIDLKAITTTPVTVDVTRDIGAAGDAVDELVTAANEVLSTLKKHTSYNAESGASGVLQGDPAARGLQMEIRSVLSSTSSTGDITHGSQVGISLTRTGEVELDRTKLDAALGGGYDAVAGFMVDGLGSSLHTFLKTVEGSGGSIQRARDAIDGRVRSYDDQIEAFEVRLALRERTLRRQFTGLETSLAQLHAQGNWLAGQLGSMGGVQ